MLSWLERTELLLGEEKLKILRKSNILVVGLGGVGAYAAEMLSRSGIENLTIVDADIVNPSNINRQLIALRSTIGKYKADVLYERLKDINPRANLNKQIIFLKDNLIDELLDSQRFDYVVDAIDTLSPKVNLIKSCLGKGIPVVSSMGAGDKTAPEQIEIKDISKSHHCPLAHMLRKRLHKIGIHKGFKVVFSPEKPREGALILCDEQNKKSNVGTISYLPVVFGCFCASVVIRDLLGEL